MRTVSTINTANGFSEQGNRIRKMNVCGYCRVSTDHLQQQYSLDAQVEHFKSLIKAKQEWNFVAVYADEGISGKNKRNRKEFLRMLRDAENNKIDLIVTKSISRFARNTIECIETVRMLKRWNVGVYFERENINTLTADSELLLSILSSVAEEEVLSVSENMKWSARKRFQQGHLMINTNRFLGYDKDEDGKLIINENQAAIVKRIFDEYIAGSGVAKIAKILSSEGIENISGNTKWSNSVIIGMLKNEKYTGDAFLQKTITLNSITLKRKKNEGEAPMYFVKDNHPAIISRETFDTVQQLIIERAKSKGNIPENSWKYQQRYVFSSKIICGQCDSVFKRTVHNSKSKTAQFYHTCGTYIEKGVGACDMKPIKEDTVKRLFVKIVNSLYKDKKIIQRYMDKIKALYEMDGEGMKILEFEEQVDELLKEERVIFQLKSKSIIDKELLEKEHAELVEKISRLRREKAVLQERIEKEDDRYKKTADIQSLVKELKEPIEEFDENLFEKMIRKIIVKEREFFVFQLYGGIEIEERYTFKYGKDLV